MCPRHANTTEEPRILLCYFSELNRMTAPNKPVFASRSVRAGAFVVLLCMQLAQQTSRSGRISPNQGSRCFLVARGTIRHVMCVCTAKFITIHLSDLNQARRVG